MSLPLEFIDDLWVRRTFSAAGHTLLIYDYFLTFNDEIRYIWNAPWTVVKVMFLINRYGNITGQTFIRLEEAGLLTHDSTLFCHWFGLITTYFMILSSESIHILVLMRAWAIWGTRRGVTKMLVGSYLTYVLILLGVSTYGADDDSIEEFQYLDLAKVCVAAMPKYVWLCYIGSFTLDTVIFILTTRSLWRYSREFQFLYPSNLLWLLVRDATIFFVLSMFNNVMIVTSWTAYSNDPKFFLAKGFSSPLLSVAGQRLVLNLKGLQTRTYSTYDLSCEVDRQLEALSGRDDIGDSDGSREP
ncbi:hypothetical protein DEU56DRAFT_237115 [Suillus clintonianus]|uniref:uncharacterized protein n=1 Tax=Suillus clintonianus TaxID=1904413 RepID=UPI001B868EC2|nr:uncharacterized protein DEU56DRAFT_237115 [Suillus clintonianus]KAG2144274.1 hypothetical protein DEU56DRAFT_237115 [Suillus clintonianus]